MESISAMLCAPSRAKLTQCLLSDTRNVSTSMRHPWSEFSVQLCRPPGEVNGWLSTATTCPAGALRQSFGRATRSPGCPVTARDLAEQRCLPCRVGRSRFDYPLLSPSSADMNAAHHARHPIPHRAIRSHCPPAQVWLFTYEPPYPSPHLHRPAESGATFTTEA
jgi:hypothetical protein